MSRGRAPLSLALSVMLLEKLGARLWRRQREILEAVFGPRRITVVQSCTGAGKSHVAAWVIWAWLLGGPDRRVITTAPTQRQVNGAVWSEMRAIWRDAKKLGLELGGTLARKAADYRGPNGREAIGYSTDSATNFAGWHSRGGTLVVVDDAQGLDDETWDTILATVTGSNDRILALANPLSPSGRFFELCKTSGGDSVNRIVISAFDTPNIKLGRVVIDGMVTQQQIDTIRDVAGEGSALWKSRVLGQFPDGTNDLAVIPLPWFERAKLEHDYWAPRLAGETPQSITMAADLAGLGVDSGITAVVRTYRARDDAGFSRLVHLVDPFRRHPKFPLENTMGTVGLLLEQRKQIRPDSFRVDAGGLGVGIYDRLREVGVPVVGLIAGSTEGVDTKRYLNLRAQMLGELREAMTPRHEDGKADHRPIVALPWIDRLVQQGRTLQMAYTSTEQMKIESKEVWRKRTDGKGGSSPDELDALAMALCSLPGGAGTASAWRKAYG